LPAQTATPTATPIPATPIPASDGLVLSVGQAVQGSLTQPRERQRFIVVGAFGEVISLGMFPTEPSGLVPRLEVYAPNGEVVVATSHPTGAVISGYTLPVTGAYIVFASADRGRTVGEYTLTLAAGLAIRDVVRTTIQLGSPIRGDLRRAGDRDAYEIDLPPLTTLSVSVAAYQSWLVPVVEVLDPAGTLLARAAATQTRRVLITPSISAGGRYTVRVSALQASTTGGYLLVVDVNSNTHDQARRPPSPSNSPSR
jgi:hypothetical protein